MIVQEGTRMRNTNFWMKFQVFFVVVISLVANSHGEGKVRRFGTRIPHEMSSHPNYQVVTTRT